jgi:hypothetical protein
LKILLKDILEIKDNFGSSLLFGKLNDFLNAKNDCILFLFIELLFKTSFKDKLLSKYVLKSFNEYSNTKFKHPIKTIPKINWEEVIGTNKLALEL